MGKVEIGDPDNSIQGKEIKIKIWSLLLTWQIDIDR